MRVHADIRLHGLTRTGYGCKIRQVPVPSFSKLRYPVFLSELGYIDGPYQVHVLCARSNLCRRATWDARLTPSVVRTWRTEHDIIPGAGVLALPPSSKDLSTPDPCRPRHCTRLHPPYPLHCNTSGSLTTISSFATPYEVRQAPAFRLVCYPILIIGRSSHNVGSQHRPRRATLFSLTREGSRRICGTLTCLG